MAIGAGSAGEIAGGDQEKDRGKEPGGEIHCGMGAVIMIASEPLQTGPAVASDVRTMTRAPAGGGHGGLTLAVCSCASGCATAASAESKNPAAIPRITMHSLLLLLMYVFLPRDYAFRNKLGGFLVAEGE